MNDTVMILPYSTRFLPWSSAFEVGCRDSSLSIYYLFAFFVTCNILKKQVVSLPWKKICYYRYVIFLILHYLFQVVVDWLILEYFRADCIPYLLEHLDRNLMSVLVWIHISMMYHQHEILKSSFRLDSQLWHYGHKHHKFS